MTFIKIQGLLAAALLAFISGCSREPQTDLPPIIAMVNGEAISLEEFDRILAGLTSGIDPESEDHDPSLFWDEALEQLIERKILLQEAKLRGIHVTRDEVEAAIAQMKGEYSEDAFSNLLKEEGLNFDQWKAELTEQLIINRVMEDLARGLQDVTDSEIRAYYGKHRKDYVKRAEVKARQIVLATEEAASAAREKLLNGADFGTLAREQSITPDKSMGGDLGYFSEGQMPEEFDIVFRLRVNEISPIVKSPYGYHIFKVEAKHPPRTQSLQDARDSIYDLLVRERAEQAQARKIEELKSKAQIKVNSAMLPKQTQTTGQKPSPVNHAE